MAQQRMRRRAADAIGQATAQAGDPTGALMTSRTTRILLILATLISGFPAGGDVDRAAAAARNRGKTKIKRAQDQD